MICYDKNIHNAGKDKIKELAKLCRKACDRIAEQKWDKVERKCRAMAEKWR